MASETKVWFITSCSSGFGLCMTQYALRKGDKVVATLRKPEHLSKLAAEYPGRLLVLRLDITKPAEVTAAFIASLERFGRIDVVVNNAVFGAVSEIEAAPDDATRPVFAVDSWDPSHVSREAARFFREVNRPMGGRLLQVTSAGVQSPVGAVYYCARWYAGQRPIMDADASPSRFTIKPLLSDDHANEFHPNRNIEVTIFELHPFCMRYSTHNVISEHTLLTMRWRGIFAHPDPMFNGDPNKFAEAVYRVACLEDPPRFFGSIEGESKAIA